MTTNLSASAVTFQRLVDQAAIDDGDESVTLDVRRPREMAMRFFDVPFFLEFCGCFAVICDRSVSWPLLGICRGGGKRRWHSE